MAPVIIAKLVRREGRLLRYIMGECFSGAYSSQIGLGIGAYYLGKVTIQCFFGNAELFGQFLVVVFHARCTKCMHGLVDVLEIMVFFTVFDQLVQQPLFHGALSALKCM